MLSKSYYDRWKWTRDATRELAPLVPETGLEFNPGDMMPLGELARHICGAVYFMIGRYLKRQVEVPDHIKQKVPLSGSAFTAELERTDVLVRKLFDELNDADLDTAIELPDGRKTTVGWVVFHLSEHEIHHRAQLKMYLKLMGIDTSAVKS